MAGTLTIRPNALIGQTGWVASSGTVNSATSDNSDSTYVTDTTGGNAYALSYFDLNFATATLPAGAVVKKVTPFIRCSQASGSVKLRVECNKDFGFFGTERNKYTVPTTDVTPTSTIKTFTLAAGGTAVPYQDFFNTILPQQIVDGLSMRIRSLSTNNAADDHRVYDVWYNVDYDEAPLASALTLSPADANTRTVRPKITWTYTDPEGAPQQGFALAIWAQADTLDAKFAAYGDGTGNGYNYSVWAFTASDGTVRQPAYLWSEQSTSEAGHQLTKDLANNATYVAYVRVYDTTGGGPNRAIGGRLTYPTSSGFTFTMQVPVPPSPPAGSIVATYEKTKYRVKLDLAASTSTVPADWAGLESIPAAPTYVNATGTTETNVANVLTGAGSLKVTSSAAGNFSMSLPAAGRASLAGYYASGAGAVVLVHVKRSVARDMSVQAVLYNTSGSSYFSRSFGWNNAQAGSSVNGFVPIMIKFSNAELGNTAAALGVTITMNSAAAAGESFWFDSFAVRPARGVLNWLANPSFESGTTAPGNFWALSSSLVTSPLAAFRTGVESDSTLQMFGSRAVRLTGTTTGTAGTLGVVQRTACIPLVGTTVRVGGSFELFQAPAGTTCNVQAVFYDVANAQVGSALTATATAATVNGKVIAKPSSATMTIPAGATQVQVTAWVASSTTVGAYNATVDGIWLVDGSTAIAADSLPQTDWTLGGLVDTQVAIVQRCLDGVNWWPLPSMAIDYNGDMVGVALPLSTGQTATTYDTIVYPGASPAYRFRTRSYDSSLGLYIYSDWSPTVYCSGSPVTDGTGVAAIRSVVDPDQYVALPLEAEDGFTFKSGSKQGVFSPIGQSYPIVVQDAVEAERFEFRALYRDGISSNMLSSLRASREMMWFIRDVDKDAWFVHFLGELTVTELRNAQRSNLLTRDSRISGTLARTAGPAGQPARFWVT